MSENDPLVSAEGAAWIMEQVSAGTATWDEAVSVLREFVRQVEGRRVDHRLDEYIASAFRRFLQQAASIDDGDPNQRAQACAALLKGLGLRKESKGRPGVAPDDGVEIALAVLEEMMEGCRPDVAVTQVAERMANEQSGHEGDLSHIPPMSERQVRAACNAHMPDAIEAWRHRYDVAYPPNTATPEEEERIAVFRQAFGSQHSK